MNPAHGPVQRQINHPPCPRPPLPRRPAPWGGPPPPPPPPPSPRPNTHHPAPPPAADERRDERRLRIGVALFAGALLVALVASIQLSTLGVSFGSLVYGTVPLWRGQGAVFRVASFDPHSGRLVPGLGAVVRLRDH